jgi:hypothetical protein
MKGKNHKKIKTTTPKKKTKEIWQEHQESNNEHKNKKQMINKEKFLNRQKKIQNGVTNQKWVKNEQT